MRDNGINNRKFTKLVKEAAQQSRDKKLKIKTLEYTLSFGEYEASVPLSLS